MIAQDIILLLEIAQDGLETERSDIYHDIGFGVIIEWF